MQRLFPPSTETSGRFGSSLKGDRSIDWTPSEISPFREYVEVLGVIALMTIVGWFVPLSYRAFGHVYLLAVVLLCLRVGRGPALFAAIISAVAWNFVFMPPRLSFSVLDFEDALMLGTYFVVALIAGQLTARIRAKELEERSREQRARALFHLTRALAGANSLGEAVHEALRQAESFFGARTAVLLVDESGALVAHPAGSLTIDDQERAAAESAWRGGREAGRFTDRLASSEGLYLPLLRAGTIFGVFGVGLPPDVTLRKTGRRELIEGFAAQIAMLVEREQLRAAGEREKLLAASDRLHRTLLDSVSHELKTPLAVLRSAAEGLKRSEPVWQAHLAGEISTATRRLDRLVANLLNQTRLESGAVKAQLDWCEVRDIINAARRELGDALAEHPLKIEVPADMSLFMADEPLMEQVVGNLLLNAARHTPAGTVVRISAAVDWRAARVLLVVSDNGPGIPAALRESLFQKFQRGNGACTGGLGLGLSIVRGFMQAQGGDVTADETPGGGARFTVFLPYVAHDGVPQE